MLALTSTREEEMKWRLAAIDAAHKAFSPVQRRAAPQRRCAAPVGRARGSIAGVPGCLGAARALSRVPSVEHVSLR